MAINKVKTQAEAAAFSFLKDQSTVLHIEDTNEIKVNGVNVITKTPEAGDVLCVTNRKDGATLLPAQDQSILWIKGNTVNFQEWPSEESSTHIKHYIFEPVGICYKVRAGNAYVCYRNGMARRWSNADRWLVDAAGTALIKGLNAATSVTINVTSWGSERTEAATVTTAKCTANDLRGNVIKIQNAIASITGNTTVSVQYAGPHDYDPIDANGHYVDPDPQNPDGVVIFNARFTGNAFNVVSCTIGTTDLNLSTCTGRDLPMSSGNYRKNGGSIYWGGANFYRFYDYYSANGGTDYSLINTGTPCSETNFNDAEDAAPLRAMYGSYKNYLRSCMCWWPTSRGGNGMYYDKGLEFTKKLTQAKYISMESGSPVVAPLYGAAYYCGGETSINALGLERGKWWLPSSGDLLDMLADITYDTTEFEPQEGAYNWDKLDQISLAIYKLNDNTFDSTQGFQFSLLGTVPDIWSTIRTTGSSGRSIYRVLFYSSDGESFGMSRANCYWACYSFPVIKVSINLK